MVHINQCVYISEYLEGGLTRTGRAMKIYSPKGMMYRSMVYLKDSGVIIKVKIKMLLLFIVYGRFADINLREMYRNVPQKLWFILLFLPGSFIYLKWKREN